jgi:hypothetical protein
MDLGRDMRGSYPHVLNPKGKTGVYGGHGNGKQKLLKYPCCTHAAEKSVPFLDNKFSLIEENRHTNAFLN